MEKTSFITDVKHGYGNGVGQVLAWTTGWVILFVLLALFGGLASAPAQPKTVQAKAKVGGASC